MNKFKLVSIIVPSVVGTAIVVPPIVVATVKEKDISTNHWQLTNPDGSLSINIDLSDQGQLSYSVKKNNANIVNKSTLGMLFTAPGKTYDFSKGLTFVKSSSNSKHFSYDCKSGKTSHVDVDYKEKVITTRIDDLFMDVTFRALNDGYGFQYSFYSDDSEVNELTWFNEFSEFNIPNYSLTYAMDYEANRQEGIDYYSYETHYMVRDYKNIGKDTMVSLPFGYETNGYYSFITESGLMGSGYHGSFLERDDNNILATVHAPAGGYDPDYTVTLPFTSPWRVSSVGSYATAFETTIVEDIQGDIEEYKPEGQPDFNYDWVEPGLTSWSWLKAGGDGDYDTQMKYVALSKNMGWKYVLLDAGWEALQDEDDHFTQLMNYAKQEPEVKVLVWVDAKRDPFYSDMDAVLQSYEDLGISGVKVDFWDGQAEKPTRLTDQMEDKQTIEQYDKFYQLAAKHHLVVNCHGCNKPTGERRRYPNVINREAVRGNEMHNVYGGQCILHTFTRGVVGPTDFTPVVLPLEHDVTIGYQMALGIIYESGIPSMADLPTVYIDEDLTTETPYTDYYKHLPASWDQSKFIQGNPEKYVVVARRKGDNWWLAGLNGTQRVIDLDFSFLGKGTYDAIIYNGGSRGENPIERTDDIITRDSKRAIQVTDNAGFVIELRKQ
ncbi:MAG: glycoside hydrolase family 97 catalytic domain-containing protein [Mycoplasmoidaceae bacterium]